MWITDSPTGALPLTCCWFPQLLRKTAEKWGPTTAPNHLFSGHSVTHPAGIVRMLAMPRAVPSLTAGSVSPAAFRAAFFSDYWVFLQRNALPWRIKVWLVSSSTSQPSTMVLSMARFFLMFSVSLTSSCITLLGTQQNALYLPKTCLTPAVSVQSACPSHPPSASPLQSRSLALFPLLFKSFLWSFWFLSSGANFARLV